MAATAAAVRQEQGQKSATTFERPCELAGRLEGFKPLYYWLEYWGDWVANGTTGHLSVLAVMSKLREDGFTSRSTADDGFPTEIRTLERALAQVRLGNRYQYSVLAMLHIGKANFREIASSYGIRRRGLERTLWYAYSGAQARVLVEDFRLLERPAPIFRRT